MEQLHKPLLVILAVSLLFLLIWLLKKNSRDDTTKIEIKPPEVIIERPNQPPVVVIPPQPSPNYLSGYWDGYTGQWLGPFRWTFDDDYRNGNQLGRNDRKNGLPARFPPIN